MGAHNFAEPSNECPSIDEWERNDAMRDYLKQDTCK